MTRNLILVLGDQLSPDLATLRSGNPAHDRVLMAEVMAEASYVKHHKKKIAFIFAAMRHFASELRERGWTVDYVTLDDPENTGSLDGEVARVVERYRPRAVIVTEPGEWRLLDAMRGWEHELGVPVNLLPDDRFICSIDAFARWAEGRKQLRMEYFYRDMRRVTGLLMDGDQPIGGKWNYDADNRKPAPDGLFLFQPHAVEPDAVTREVLELVADRFDDNFGDLLPFTYAVTRRDAEAALTHFIADSLPHFGDYQDAMLVGRPYLYHAVIAQYLNCGLLDARAVCSAVEEAYTRGHVPLNAAEGFIRQIIGWREYVRGIYWLKMPDYALSNALGADRPLPAFYWTAETDLACMRAAISQTKELAYAHHIQRLMVTGNFALLAGIDPHALHEWYLSVYADAYEWVELPNTIGMSQFADNGLLASKPYAASGAYINRMSNYCATCRYDVKQRTGDTACPFNALYWAFIARHRVRLQSNPRMAQMVRTYDNFSAEERARITSRAEAILGALT